MNKYVLLALLPLLFCSGLQAQTDRYTEKIYALYQAKKYSKVLKYKKGKEESMSSKSLYYKGMSHYMLENDGDALNYLNQALEKGPADHDMHFYKGKVLYYMERFEESITSFNQAIALHSNEPDFYASKAESFYQLDAYDSTVFYMRKALLFEKRDPRWHMILGIALQEQKEYLEAVEAYTSALHMIGEDDSRHQLCSYNLGLCHQLSQRFEKAKESFREHLGLYPDDYEAVAKMIQCHYALDEFKETETLKSQLYKAHGLNKLPRHMRSMFCTDQFLWLEYRIMVFESFGKRPTDPIDWTYTFYKNDMEGETVLKVQTQLDTTAEEKIYHLYRIENDILSFYDQYTFSEEVDYRSLREAVKSILSEDVEPKRNFVNYSTWLEEESIKLSAVSNLERDGSSVEKAVIAESVPWEYDWLNQYYPGYEFHMQSLRFIDNKPYDVLNITTAQGKKKDVYFDISGFFGKGF